MQNFKEVLLFKRMVTPVFIHVIFWVLIVMAIISAVTSLVQHNFLIGLMSLIVGPIMIRVGCEVMMAFFRLHDYIADIRNKIMQEKV